MDKEIIENLRLVHGSYNISVMLLFVYQGLLGLKIRRGRRAGIQKINVIKRHRKMGPVLAMIGIGGFFIGVTLIYLDYGRVLKYPLHFVNGLAIVFAILSTYLVSRNIIGADSRWRQVHLRRGILLLFLYVFQVMVGMDILF